MQTSTTTKPTSRAPRSSRQLMLLISAAVLLAMIGTCLVGQLVLYVLMPHGALYQHNLLSRLSADYHAWEVGAIPPIPPPNAQAVLAPADPIAPAISTPTPTARPTPAPQPTAPSADRTPDGGNAPTTPAASL